MPELEGIPGGRTKAWGADGCRGGWFYFGLAEGGIGFGVASELRELADRVSPGSALFVDIPIGLRDTGDRERLCDLEARRFLSPLRGSSVFPAPSRPALYVGDYAEASRLNRELLGKGLSKQSWLIMPKIREVDELLRARPRLRGQVRESHPEVCFAALAGGPMRHSKKSAKGFDERITLLTEHLPTAAELVERAYRAHRRVGVQCDDVVDALVVALCALHAGECSTLPAVPEIDAAGLAMEIVYWSCRSRE